MAFLKCHCRVLGYLYRCVQDKSEAIQFICLLAKQLIIISMCQGSMLDTGGLQKQGTAILKELLCNEITFISYFTLETFKEFFQLF